MNTTQIPLMSKQAVHTRIMTTVSMDMQEKANIILHGQVEDSVFVGMKERQQTEESEGKL
jgi:hypothetical protein